MTKITASPDNLMRQAPETVKLYLSEAIKAIDGQFGKDFAAQHPDLVAAFIKTSAIDFATTIFAQNMQNLCEYIGDLKKD